MISNAVESPERKNLSGGDYFNRQGGLERIASSCIWFIRGERKNAELKSPGEVYTEINDNYKTPVVEVIPPETLFKQSAALGKMIKNLRKDDAPVYINDLFAKNPESLYNFHPQAVIRASAENDCILDKYVGSCPELQDCYRSNSRWVKIQPGVAESIERNSKNIKLVK